MLETNDPGGCSDWTVSVQEYMSTVSLGKELVLLGTSGTFLEPPLRVIVLLPLDCSGCLKCSLKRRISRFNSSGDRVIAHAK